MYICIQFMHTTHHGLLDLLAYIMDKIYDGHAWCTNKTTNNKHLKQAWYDFLKVHMCE